MKVNFITYSDELYRDRQAILDNHAKQIFDVTHSYNSEWLMTTDFYLENKIILDKTRGNGYWLWKPFIILETLKKMDDNDVLLYLDSGDIFTDGVVGFLKEYFQSLQMV